MDVLVESAVRTMGSAWTETADQRRYVPVVHDAVNSVVPEVLHEEEEHDLRARDCQIQARKAKREMRRTCGTIWPKNDGNGTSHVFMPTATAMGWKR